MIEINVSGGRMEVSLIRTTREGCLSCGQPSDREVCDTCALVDRTAKAEPGNVLRIPSGRRAAWMKAAGWKLRGAQGELGIYKSRDGARWVVQDRLGETICIRFDAGR